MKINFEDRSYIELVKSTLPGKFIITIVARDGKDPLATIANSVELTTEQLNQLTKFE
jgi:hypothetical protein